MLEIGRKAPDFTLPDQNLKSVTLSSFLGKKVILYFYPKDDTPGCTQQACTFRDSYSEFQALNAVIIGISKDSSTSHQKFIKKYQLPFLLLADEEKAAIQAYDVWKEKNMYGKKVMGVQRSTFIIDEKGNIEKIFVKANPETNADEILAYLK
ncbi:MAG: thioredoxin-dependent thiol peroxidase [Bacilli bacterium]|nr:thioredoxin-dependent thiol peroxidase [Bacilli bacterium]